MKRLVFAFLLLTWPASPSWAAGLELSIHDGLVSLNAQDVTVRQILTEWARIGQTRIVNVERITGGPITLQIENMPEKQALDIVLRSIPGYIALPRATPVADGSLYDRILIMATTTAVAAARPQPGPAFPGMQSTMPGVQGGTVTQLRPNLPSPFPPGMLPEPPNSADQMDDPAIAAAAAAGLVPIPAVTPGAAPLMPPGAPAQQGASPAAPGVGSPTNPWNAPVGTSLPGLAPPPPAAQAPPPPAGQAPPPTRVRPPQADR